MAQTSIRVRLPQWVWRHFVSLARRRRRKPEAYAEQVCRDAIQRFLDEQLLKDTYRAAQRSGVREEDVEEIIRRRRQERALREQNGREKKSECGW